MPYGPSVGLVGGNITACHESKCWLLGKSTWEAGPDTVQRRWYGTSAVLPSGGLLLVGGRHSPTTTEIVKPEKSVAAFTLSPGRDNHCSVLTEDSSILMTGGRGTLTMVQEYTVNDQGDSISSKDLPSLNQGRQAHACGLYYIGATKVSSPPSTSTQGATQVAIVAGGVGSSILDSTETLDLSNAGAHWVLRAGLLPSPRRGLRGATLGNVFYVSGGVDGSTGKDLDAVLGWTEASNEWTPAGTMATARRYHAVAAVPSTALAEWCG
jgi:hypothetical protein